MNGLDNRVVVFDAFGTLIKPVPRLGPYQKLARLAGADALAYRHRVLCEDIPFRDLARSLGRDGDAYPLGDDLDREVAGLSLFDDVEPTLVQLEAAGIRYAICSNLGHAYGSGVRRIVPRASAFVFSYEVNAAKPDAEIYRAVTKALAVDPRDVVFVGDTPAADVAGPRNFGMAAALIERSSGGTLLGSILDALRHADAGDKLA